MPPLPLCHVYKRVVSDMNTVLRDSLYLGPSELSRDGTLPRVNLAPFHLEMEVLVNRWGPAVRT